MAWPAPTGEDMVVSAEPGDFITRWDLAWHARVVGSITRRERLRLVLSQPSCILLAAVAWSSYHLFRWLPTVLVAGLTAWVVATWLR